MRCYVKGCIWSGNRVPDAVARSVLSLQFCIIIKNLYFPYKPFWYQYCCCDRFL